jgi:hypothetical protein
MSCKLTQELRERDDNGRRKERWLGGTAAQFKFIM